MIIFEYVFTQPLHSRGFVAKLLDCGLEVNEFEL